MSSPSLSGDLAQEPRSAPPEFSRRISVRRLLPWVIVLLQLAWWSQALWPIVPVEGDEQGVIFGVEGILRHDEVLNHLRYTYEVQPGSYHLLAALTRLTGASVETVFGVATMVGAAGFALAGAWLLRLLLRWPLGWTLAAMLWCQEVTTAACYSNTSALAGGFAILAVILAARPQPWGLLCSGLAVAVGGWLRADSLLVAPACLAVIYWQQRAWRPAVIRTAAIAATALVSVAVLYWVSGTSLFAGLGAYRERGYLLSGWRILAETPLQLLSPALALGALAGCGLLVARRELALGLVVLCGTIATLAAYGPSLTTSKYFYYLVPFALVPALYSVDRLRRHPSWLAGFAIVAVLLGDGLLGLRTLSPSQRFFTLKPTLVSLVRIAKPTKVFELVVGPGELIFNCDGFRVRTGQFFAPPCWHREKMRVRTDLATIRSWLADGRELTIFWSDWLPRQIATREFLAAGFRPLDRKPPETGAAPGEEWRRPGQAAHLAYLGYAGSIYQPPGPGPASTTGPDTYFIGDQANRPLTELADHQSWHLLSATTEGFTTLYQRR